ncbi:hypothetical protein J42TS3_20310 [Paenibacillus vini]|uniref:Secreted protein n=1 Tax=Paenibacillus vini TaxID=1476024 RepID=A0ABQ4MAG9_9BACL|nr:hypothetical protein J42TS3_20310 [Paenibacillus vini]
MSFTAYAVFGAHAPLAAAFTDGKAAKNVDRNTAKTTKSDKGLNECLLLVIFKPPCFGLSAARHLDMPQVLTVLRFHFISTF